MSRIIRPLSLCAVFGVALGCSSTVTPAPASSGSGGSGSGGGGGGEGGSDTSVSSSGSGAGGSEPGTKTLTAQMGPLTIASGQEAVKCIVVDLGNSEGAFVRKFRTKLNQGSHHMIVYRTNQPENPDPVPCMSFEAAGGAAIFIAQQEHAELTFPTDPSGVPVGLELQPNQLLTLEMHYINATSGPLDVLGTVEMDVLPVSSNVIKSGFSFQGAFGIPEIPAQSEQDTGVLFEEGIPGTHVFALTTHQHHLGTQMRVWHAKDVNDLSTLVADSHSWNDPPLELFDPPLELPAGGSKGFAYDCHWKNPTPQTVYGGLGANDEMCFFWSYYYPTGG
jgi:hypothetical protein